jgi:hypothetical protein
VSSVCPFDLPSGLEVEGEADVWSPHVSEWRELVELVFFPNTVICGQATQELATPNPTEKGYKLRQIIEKVHLLTI